MAKFTLLKTEGKARRARFETVHGTIETPVFMNVGTSAAIKGGRVYDSSVTKWIVERVLSLPDVTVCPHGRPIAYRLTKNELDRQFERIK